MKINKKTLKIGQQFLIGKGVFGAREGKVSCGENPCLIQEKALYENDPGCGLLFWN